MCTKHQRKRNLNENQECKIIMFCYFNQVTCFYLKIYNFFTDQNLFNNLLMVNTVNQNQYARDNFCDLLLKKRFKYEQH